MNPNVLEVIGPRFLSQVPTLSHRNKGLNFPIPTGLRCKPSRVWGVGVL